MHHHPAMVTGAQCALRGEMGVVRFVVVARGDQDPIAGLGGVHCRLNGVVLAGVAVIGPDEQDGGRRCARRRAGRSREPAQGVALVRRLPKTTTRSVPCVLPTTASDA